MLDSTTGLQIIDEIFPAYLTRWFWNGRHFFIFWDKDLFFLYNPILGSSLGVQKELGKNLFFS